MGNNATVLTNPTPTHSTSHNFSLERSVLCPTFSTLTFKTSRDGSPMHVAVKANISLAFMKHKILAKE